MLTEAIDTIQSVVGIELALWNEDMVSLDRIERQIEEHARVVRARHGQHPQGTSGGVHSDLWTPGLGDRGNMHPL